MANIAACPNCSTRNRVPVVASGRPQCAACHAPLPWLVDVTERDFDAAVAGPGTVLVDLWAPWCGPCKVMAPVLERMAAGHAGRLKIVKVDVDTAPGVSARFQVQGIPTLLLFQDGRLVGRKVGAAPEGALEAWLAAPAT